MLTQKSECLLSVFQARAPLGDSARALAMSALLPSQELAESRRLAGCNPLEDVGHPAYSYAATTSIVSGANRRLIASMSLATGLRRGGHRFRRSRQVSTYAIC